MKTTYEAPELQSQGTFRQATGFVAFGGGWGGGGWSRWGGWGGNWGGGWGGGGWGW